MGFLVYGVLGLAAILLVIGSRRRSRLALTSGVLLFAVGLATLGILQTRNGTYWLGILYFIAAGSQGYAGIRTWTRWNSKTEGSDPQT
jgi:hypothetical protein